MQVRVQGTHSLIDWVILGSREAWLKEGNIPEHVGSWKFIEEVQQILRELEMRQAIYVCPCF